VDTRVLLPGFPAIRNRVQEPQVVASRETFAGPMTLLFGTLTAWASI
jgi:starch synthase